MRSFPQLLYIAQKYLNKVFTPRDCQVFAWLYEGLGMSSELLEYLVEYCAQNGHSSVRYLETVAVSWHEKGIKHLRRHGSWEQLIRKIPLRSCGPLELTTARQRLLSRP